MSKHATARAMLKTAGMMTMAVIFTSGCSVELQRRHTSDIGRIRALKEEVDRLEKEKEEELRRMESAKKDLETRLKKEIAAKEIKVEQLERGLVVTLLDKILFDSGKAVIRVEAYDALDKVASVLAGELKEQRISIEGHTDNEPIKYSGWKSNWELSSARAMSVLHYFEAEKGIAPGRLCVVAYGEHHPVTENATKEGRKQNRRVEVVILPKAAVR
jgi:chemotaxis protein MotB